jgi:hypothetical protein
MNCRIYGEINQAREQGVIMTEEEYDALDEYYTKTAEFRYHKP